LNEGKRKTKKYRIEIKVPSNKKIGPKKFEISRTQTLGPVLKK